MFTYNWPSDPITMLLAACWRRLVRPLTTVSGAPLGVSWPEPMDSATMSAQKPAGTVSPALSVAQTGLAACAVAELATANESVTASMGVRIGPIIYRDSASGACRLVTPCHHGRCSN